MNNDAPAKIVMIESSLRCFTFGLLGLLPFIGVPFSIAALWNAGKTRVREKQYWNPAKMYRDWGIICAATGMVVWIMIGVVVIWNVTTGAWNND